MLNRASYSSLILRIRSQYRREIRGKSFESLRNMCFSWIYPSMLLITCYFANQMYNAWQGPFPMNFIEFRTYIETPVHELHLYGITFFLPQVFFPSEYVQVELGENIISESINNTFYLYENAQSDGKLVSIFNQLVERSIDTEKFCVFVKFPAYEQPYWKIPHPYNFQSFHLKTLQCIVKQLNISEQWSDKSIYISHIKEIYNENIELFNKKVIKKCGILIGYRYLSDEIVYSKFSNEFSYFDKNHVRTFYASSSYTCYTAYIFICIFICYSLKNLIKIVLLLNQIISPSFPPMEYLIAKQLKMISLENFDQILYETNYQNSYQDRLFILYDKYLVISLIDFEEKNEKILENFFENSPVIILPIEKVFSVTYDRIFLDIYHRESIYLRQYSNNIYFNPSNWLHERLMILNEQYRLNWEKQRFRQVHTEEDRSFLQTLIKEETQYQLNQTRNNINPITTAASPHVIAHFRLADRFVVTENLLGTTCSICLEDFQLDQYFVQWSCIAQHRYHFHCMLNVLRITNKCPLCRQPVPPENSRFF